MIIHAAQIDNRFFQGMMQGNYLLYIKASLLRDMKHQSTSFVLSITFIIAFILL